VSIIRPLRIAGIAIAFFAAFNFSQSVTAARSGGATAPGIVPAIAALTLFFTINAFVSERTQGPETDRRKDLLWGLATGGIGIIVQRLAG
jgi:hypothetical protein